MVLIAASIFARRPQSRSSTSRLASQPFSIWPIRMLVAGDKSDRQADWCRTGIPQAEQIYADYLAEREKEMGS
jgi:hypothetical protein